MNEINGHNKTLIVLGTIILWVGWYGFNPGSTLKIVGLSKVAGKVAAITTIAAAASGIAAVTFQSFFHKHYDISFFCNAILAGLVAVTAPCAVIDPWAAFLIGLSATFVFYYATHFVLYLKIDDPVGAGPLHGKNSFLMLSPY